MFICIEIITRTFLSTVTNFNIFRYGFDKNIKIILIDPSEFKFEITKFKVFADDKKNLPNTNYAWAFGGSTTKGYNCPQGQSSWVYFLNSLNKDIRFINYGKKGTTSDNSLVSLIDLLKKKKPPNIILWAHRFNEDQVIYHGPNFNKELIGKYKDISSYNKNKFIFFMRRIEKTIYANSTFYFLFNEFSRSLLRKYGYLKDYVGAKEPSKDDYNMALENYRLNTQKVIYLANKNEIDLYIVLLPRPEDYSILSFSEKMFSKKVHK